MNQSVFAALMLAALSTGSAHAGLFDTLSKVNDAMNAVRGTQTAAAPVSTPTQAAIISQQALQGMTALDCASLQLLATSVEQQLQAVPQENQVSKTAGMLGKAGGLFASVGALAGVDVKAIQQAGQLAQQANSLAANTSTAPVQSSSELTQQLSALRLIQHSKSCQ